jgi:RNA polymerase sigma factor (sigma-70 family)
MTSSDKSELFLSVIEGHKGIIHKIALAYAPDKESKEDLVQEIMLQLWKSFDRYNPQFKYSTWIYKVALNVSLAAARKESNRTKRMDPLREEMLSLVDTPGATNGPRAAEADAHFVQLQGFIAGLKEIDRAIMLLYLEERSQKEIAEIMGMTPTNISTRIGRIKDTLRQKFTELPQ